MAGLPTKCYGRIFKTIARATSLCALSVLMLVSRRAHRTGFGRRSLTAYLVHGFPVRGLLAAGVFAWLARMFPAFAQRLLCGVAGAVIAAMLSMRYADRLAAPLTRPVAWVRGWLR
ncbi:MAG: hypothetical protein ACREPK_09245 [Rhodanobacteraceae bacterium]